MYIHDAGFMEDNLDAGWLGRQGVALALHSAADVLRTKDLPVVMTFLISRALVGSALFFYILIFLHYSSGDLGNVLWFDKLANCFIE